MNLRTITYNGINSIKYGLFVDEAKISYPEKKKVKKEVPYMSGSYDFSALYGECPYEERTLVYYMDLIADTPKDMQDYKDAIVKWLSVDKQIPLYDSDIRGYYYLAECTKFEAADDDIYSRLTITFTAYPYKIASTMIGEYFDSSYDYNFDSFISSTYFVSGSLVLGLLNDGIRKSKLMIEVDSVMTISIEGKSYDLSIGRNEISGNVLPVGMTNVTVTGTGNITFLYRKEVL